MYFWLKNIEFSKDSVIVGACLVDPALLSTRMTLLFILISIQNYRIIGQNAISKSEGSFQILYFLSHFQLFAHILQSIFLNCICPEKNLTTRFNESMIWFFVPYFDLNCTSVGYGYTWLNTTEYSSEIRNEIAFL